MRRVVLPRRWRVVQEALFFVSVCPVVLAAVLYRNVFITYAAFWKVAAVGAAILVVCGVFYRAEGRGSLVYLRPDEAEELLRDKRLKLHDPGEGGRSMRDGSAGAASSVLTWRRLLWGVVVVAAVGTQLPLRGILAAALGVELLAGIVHAARVWSAGREE